MDKRKRFRKIADEVAKDAADDPWTKEPWPQWFQNVVIRLGRVFIPSLKRSDCKENRERFEGYGLAFVSQLIDKAEAVETKKFPKDPVFAALKMELKNLATTETKKVQSALQAAADLPRKLSGEVFAGYTEGIQKKTVDVALNRIVDSQSAQICLYLMFARPWIEAKKVPTVTTLFQQFMKIREAFPGQKEFFRTNAQARKSLEHHFRKICTLDRVRLKGPGQPRKRIKTTGKRAR
jgi:hypothetical protein